MYSMGFSISRVFLFGFGDFLWRGFLQLLVGVRRFLVEFGANASAYLKFIPCVDVFSRFQVFMLCICDGHDFFKLDSVFLGYNDDFGLSKTPRIILDF